MAAPKKAAPAAGMKKGKKPATPVKGANAKKPVQNYKRNSPPNGKGGK